MIDAAGANQAALLAGLHARAFDRPWSAAEIAKLMENASVFAILSQPADGADGFAMGWAVAGDAELLTVAVIPEARRKGVGAALVSALCAAALLRGAVSLHLEVAEDNAAARGLYRKLGFEDAGRRHAYYPGAQGAIDAIVMRRKLPAPAL